MNLRQPSMKHPTAAEAPIIVRPADDLAGGHAPVGAQGLARGR